MDGSPIIPIFFCGLISALIGGLIGQSRGRSGEGAILGMLLGPLGWLLIFAGSDSRPKCIACRMVIDPEASICPHCRTPVVHPTSSDNSPSRPARQCSESDQFFVLYEGKSHGPLELASIRRKIARGELAPNIPVAQQGDEEWIPVNCLPVPPEQAPVWMIITFCTVGIFIFLFVMLILFGSALKH